MNIINNETLGDIAGRYDISTDEMLRIREVANSQSEFTQIWSNEDWWTDASEIIRLISEETADKKDILNVLEDGVALEYLRDKHASDIFHNVEAIEAAHARIKQALN